MTDATRSQLEQAYRLIQQDDLDRAIAILKPITAAEPDNVDAWWLLAHAVSDPQDAREPLQKILQIDPDHSEARQLLADLDTEFPAFETAPASDPGFPDDLSLDNLFGDSPQPSSTSSSISSSDLDQLLGQRSTPTGNEELSFANNALDFGTDFDMSSDPVESPTADMFAEPGFLANVDVLEEEQKKADTRKEKRDAAKAAREKEKAERDAEAARKKAAKAQPAEPLDPFELERRANSRPNRVLLFAVLVLLIVVIGGGATFMLLPRLLPQDGGAPPIPLTPNGTSAPTAVAAVGTPDINSTLQATNDLFTANRFVKPNAAVSQTVFGDTLVVQVCGVAGPRLIEDVSKAMDIVAQEASKIKGSLKAAGVDFLNCTRDGVKLTTVVAPIDAVTAYVNGGMSDKRTYRASWKRN